MPQTSKKATVQDIADALELSRATVSKVLNGSQGVPAHTIERVLEKATQLNYKQFAYLQKKTDAKKIPVRGGNVALFAHIIPAQFHIASAFLTGLEQALSTRGYALTIHILSSEIIESNALPGNFYAESTDAIVCLELFDLAYSKMLCALHKPLLFFDVNCAAVTQNLEADILLMQNRSYVYEMLTRVIQTYQLPTVGFVGDANHCLSFRERYEGFVCALHDCKLHVDPDMCILGEDEKFSSTEWLLEKLQKMKHIPDLFFCANDLLAVRLQPCFAQLGIRVPKDVLLCGFDDTPSLNSINFNLTTVHVPGMALGRNAADMILRRIQDPALPYVRTYLQCAIKFRATTEKVDEK